MTTEDDLLLTTRALGAIVEAMDPRPRLALDADGRLLWVSPRAEGLLARSPGGRPTLPDSLALAARDFAAIEDGKAPPHVVLCRVELPDSGSVEVRAELHLVRSTQGDRFVAVTLDPTDAARPTRLVHRLGLSYAQAAVLGVLAEGRSNAEIAARLNVSVDTVKTHMRAILRKLGVKSRLAAALLARESG